MRVLFQIAICICMITFAGGTVAYILNGPEFGGGILLMAIWIIFFTVIKKAILFEFGAHKMKAAPDAASSERINVLEKRLTDIQDIVITIDEKLSRIEHGVDTPVKES